MTSIKKNAIFRYSPSEYVFRIFLGILALIVVYPIYYTVMVSVSTYKDIADSLLLIIPEKLDLSSYSLIFEMLGIGNALMISVIVTVLGTLVNLVVSVALGYGLSKSSLPGRKVILYLILFTMLFEGGLVPYYFTIRKLGLINNILVMVLPLAVNTFFLFILLSYFRRIPASLEESAKLDGANDILILVRIILPISMPTIAAIGLFYAVNRWNEWWHAMLFLTDDNLFPLQLILRNLLVSFDQMTSDTGGAGIMDRYSSVFSPSLKMASVIISTVPIMLVYPFLQKHFAKGIMIGSIKG